MVLSKLGSTLSFSSLRLSNAGRYACNVTVNEKFYRENIDITLFSKFKYQIFLSSYDVCKTSSPSSRICSDYKFTR